ncbi:MAG TPA: ATP-dependent DNA helicase [Pseudonocardia sp.]|nr:ATP-dependent DNA helicase [Pseudonocardia sp.]
MRRAPAPVRVPVWEEAARRVLEHASGPLRVLGGPGTGKTALLLACVAARVRAGVDPGRVLLLVGSRRAAGELRDRLTGLLRGPDADGDAGRTVRETPVRTVHSYAFGVLRLHAARHGDPPPRLLAGAEQDAVVRDLLAGELAGDVAGSGWPVAVRPALPLPGFAAELRELLARAAERGLGPDELVAVGEENGVPEWVAAGRFFARYEQVVLLRGAAGRGAPQATAPALDAAELVAAALDALASDRDLLAAERHRVRHLLVDDAQDLDPQQMELVRALGATARTTLLAGDPDQAVLAFRGADPGGLAAVDAPTVVLRADHRGAPAIRVAAARVAARLPGAGPGRARTAPRAGGPGPDESTGGPSGPGRSHRAGGAAGPGTGDGGGTGSGVAPEDGTVLVRVFGSAAQEAAWIADRLRRAHLTGGVAWSQMAVLARSARRALPALRRALLAAGVPIAAPADELPLAQRPAVAPLLLVLRCAARPALIDADAAAALLASPLGAADPMRMRRLRRGLLRLHAAGSGSGTPPGPGPGDAGPAAGGAAGERGSACGGAGSGEGAERAGSDPLLVELLRAAAEGRPDPLVALPRHETAPLRRVGALLAIAGDGVRDGESAEEVLWRVWQATGLAGRWSEAGARGGPVGAAADRDLDAVLALFDAAARYTDRLPGADVAGFAEYLADQQLPGESLAARAPEGEAVALLTAHAARGREWRVVAVPGVQEGSWPDLRLRGSLLGTERLVDVLGGVAAPADPVSRTAPLLAEERRLFYVACTRARETLLVTAVQGEDEQPSRFLDELDPVAADHAERPVHRPGRALVLAELVGELRRAVTAPAGDGTRDGRERAAAQLARLAAAGVPGAHPDEWYGLAPVSSEAPLRAPEDVVPISPSDVERIARCPLRWVLERHGGGDPGALAAVTGSLVHALVQAGAAGADAAELEGALRAAWARLDAGAPWFGRRELDRVRAMLAAFDGWVRASRAEGLRLVAVEQPVQLDLPAEEGPGGRGAVRLRGRVDRLEIDAQGRPVVVDVKTGRTAPGARAVAEHPQLAVYQLAAALGAFDDVLGAPAPGPGGARLVYVADRRATGEPKEPAQPPLDDGELARWQEEVRARAADTAGARFTARAASDCDRCPVRTSCPAQDAGRPVPE